MYTQYLIVECSVPPPPLQFVLRVEHHGRLFSSESVSLPVLLSSEESSKSKQNGDISLKSAVVQLKPQDTKSDSEDDDLWNVSSSCVNE